MSTLLLDRQDITATDPTTRLRTLMAAVRVCFTWFGSRKSLTPEQKSQAADTFDAEGEFLSARKKLLDSSHPAMKAVTAVRGQVINYWRRISLPYPEPGIRLIRQEAATNSSTSSSGRLNAWSAASRRNNYATTRRCDSRSPRSSRACRRRSMACWSIGRDGISCGGRAKGA